MSITAVLCRSVSSKVALVNRGIGASTAHPLYRLPLNRGIMAPRLRPVAAAADPITSVTASEKPKDDVQGAMLEPSIANKLWVRGLTVGGSVAVAAGSTVLLPSTALTFLHLTAFATFFGTNLWNSFFVGFTMFKNMPRQTFGRVQSKLFPLYFALTTSCNVLLLGSLVAVGSTAAVPSNVVTLLAVSLAGNLVNWFALEPLCTKLMFARYDIENKDAKTEEDQAQIKTLYKKFGMFHGISSMINLAVFCCAAAHGWYLSSLITLPNFA